MAAAGRTVSAALPLFAPAFLATVWLVAGSAHLARPGELRRSLAEHRLLPPGRSGALARLVTVTELTLGALALVALVGGPVSLRPVALASALVAGGFLVYLGALLSRGPAPRASCGCSPISAPVTRWSLLPAASIGAVGVAATVGEVSPVAIPVSTAALLSAGWGVTLAVFTLSLPALVTAPAVPVHRELSS